MGGVAEATSAAPASQLKGPTLHGASPFARRAAMLRSDAIEFAQERPLLVHESA